MKRFKIEKLIRDNLPEIMRAQGVKVHDRVMDHNEFISKLKDKLLEEAEEVKQTTHLDHLTEELADLLEVMKTLCNATGIAEEQIEKIRLQKRKEKGGFDRKIYNHFVDIEESNPAINYFSKKQIITG